MFFQKLLAFLSLIVLVSGSAIPAVKRSDPTSVSYAGSASVDWLDIYGNIHIRVFWVSEYGDLFMDVFDGPNGQWKSKSTPYSGLNHGRADSLAAVTLRSNSQIGLHHTIQVFYTAGNNKAMKSAKFDVIDSTWTVDQSFNDLGIAGVAPRAAVAWDNEGTWAYSSIRVFYAKLLSTSAGPVYNAGLFQLQGENNGWAAGNGGNAFWTFQQNGDEFGNTLAAVTFMKDTAREFRVYYWDTNFMGELSYSGGSWTLGPKWGLIKNEKNLRLPMSAVAVGGYAAGDTLRWIRVIRHVTKTDGSDKITQWKWDSTWSISDLPSTCATGTKGDVQTSLIEFNGALRYYQYYPGTNSKIVEESMDGSGSWSPHTAYLDYNP